MRPCPSHHGQEAKESKRKKIKGGAKAPKSNARLIRKAPQPKEAIKEGLMRTDGSCTPFRPKKEEGDKILTKSNTKIQGGKG